MNESRNPNLKARAAIFVVAALLTQFLFLGTTPVHALQSAFPIVGMAVHPSGSGYWVVASDGGVFSFGAAQFHGSTGAIKLNKPVVGMAAHPSGDGYWLVASDGGIFAFGSARFFGSTGAITLNQPVVGMAATPSGNGYWLVASDGGIFAFGDAGFFGSTGSIRLNQPVVGMAAHPSGGGYWLVASDGGIFAFGNAGFFGSTGAITLNQPVVGMAAHSSGNGYWLVASDGGIFAFGSAPFRGSTGSLRLAEPMVGMGAHPIGDGYWLVARDGGIFAFNVQYWGSVPGIGTENIPPPPPPEWIDQAALERPLITTSTALPLFLHGGESTSWSISGTGGHGQGAYGQALGSSNCSNTAGLAVDDAFESAATSTARNAFDYGAGIWVNNQLYNPGGSVNFADREGARGPMTLSGPIDMSGFQTSVEYYAALNSSTLRTFVSLKNPRPTETVEVIVTFASNLGADEAEVGIGPTGTSSGDNSFDTPDRWAITSWSGAPSRQKAVIGNVFYGQASDVEQEGGFATATKVSTNDGVITAGKPGRVFECNTRGGIAMDITIRLEPGDTRSLMFFQQIFEEAPIANSVTGPTYNQASTLTDDLLAGLTAAQLSTLVNWPFDFEHFYATGPGIGGGPRAKSFAIGGTNSVSTFASFLPYDPNMRGGNSVALANLDEDADIEFVVAPGPHSGVSPDVHIFDIDPETGEQTLGPTATIFASKTYGSGFHGGVHVATGQLDGIARREIIIAPMSGALPIKVFRTEASLLWEPFVDIFPFGTSYSGGMTIAAGDVIGDSREELIVGGGPDASPQILIFSIGADKSVSDVFIQGSRGFSPYPGYTGGVNVQAANFDATDTVEEMVIAGRGTSGESRVKIMRITSPAEPVQTVFSFVPPFSSVARVAAGDVNQTGFGTRIAELILASGPGEEPRVKIFGLNTSNFNMYIDPVQHSDELVYNAGFRGGVWVSAIQI